MKQIKMVKRFCLVCVLTVLLLPGNAVFAAGGTSIDGYYDDWEGIPKTKITWDSHNANEIHEAAVVMDEEYLYAYVQLNDLYQPHIPVSEYTIVINGKTNIFNIQVKDASGAPNWAVDPLKLPDGTYVEELGVFNRNMPNYSLGDAALKITQDTPNDALEFRIKLSVLEELYGFPEGTIVNGAQIETYNPHLGPQGVELVGSSSGAFVGVLLCIASVGLVMIFRKKRKLVG